MHWFFVAVLSGLLLTPHSVEAMEISVRSVGFAGIHFGLTDATTSALFGPFWTDVVPDPLQGLYTPVTGHFDLTSGPLVDLTLQTNPSGVVTDSFYTYAPGQLSITGNWRELFGGPIVSGVFIAPVDLTIHVFEDSHCVHGLCGTARLSLGEGLFDPAFAGVLGISGASSPSSFAWQLDGILGTPASATRIGASALGDFTVRITVPEPTTDALLLVTAGALWLRRRATLQRGQ